MIGRTLCPECGFESAHVKQSAKCLYRYCPDCGSQYHARTDRQRQLLSEKTRALPTPTPTDGDASISVTRHENSPPTPTQPTPTEATPTEATPIPTPSEDAQATSTPKRRGLFS